MLYSYVLYLMLDPEKNRDELEYKAQKGGGDLPWLEITVGKALIRISFDGIAGTYKVWLDGESEKVKEQLMNMGYVEEGDYLVKSADENIIFDDMKSIVGL